MNDILPPDSARWEWFEDTVRALMRRYGYLNIRVPIVEPTPLFVRGLGEVTDIVEKEMYSFIDSMNGDALTLRPEGTAGVVRAAIEHSMLYDGGKRLSTSARCSATSGRSGPLPAVPPGGRRGAGLCGPDVDAEVILMCRSLWRDLGLTRRAAGLNSLGQPPSAAPTARR
jgi:histidyl-tRNA synthetase